jgi:hypothetical protein
LNKRFVSISQKWEKFFVMERAITSPKRGQKYVRFPHSLSLVPSLLAHTNFLNVYISTWLKWRKHMKIVSLKIGSLWEGISSHMHIYTQTHSLTHSLNTRTNILFLQKHQKYTFSEWEKNLREYRHLNRTKTVSRYYTPVIKEQTTLLAQWRERLQLETENAWTSFLR